MSTLSLLAPSWDVNAATAPDELLLEEICRGNDSAFTTLVKRYHSAMVRLAAAYVSSSALAEEAAQEAWIAILKSCRRFEGRSSVRTWMFRILINRAVSHASREGRGDRFIATAIDRELAERPADVERFHPLTGSWVIPPPTWTPEERLLAAEVRDKLERAIAALPVVQRQVITLRDVCGWEAREVCELYGINDSNQRVLLHRARARVRRSLEEFLCGKDAA